MAINQHIKYNLFKRIKNKVSSIMQFLSRAASQEKPYVFFRYKTSRTHPGFSKFYDDPPVKWANQNKAKLLHWISYPDFIDNRPFIIEPNDHPLSVHGWKGSPTADVSNLDKLISDSIELYEKKSCKAIILSSKKYVDIFKEYIPENLWTKLVLFPSDIGAIPKIFSVSERQKEKNIKFLCLASDYERKGLELIVKAWSAIENKGDSVLTIVCPKFPEYLKKNQNQNLRLIEAGPISDDFKRDLHLTHHVALCPTLIDGGTNIIEAIEYGMPVISSEYHRSSTYIIGDMGFIVQSPFQYYDTRHYGKTWKSIDQYLNVVDTAIINGKYDSVIEEWTKYMTIYINDISLIYTHGQNSYNAASTILSHAKRNSLLRGLYLKTA
jgi:glycosyltransferase involved in cell wall biosynthesis